MKINISNTEKYFIHNGRIEKTDNLTIDLPDTTKVFYEVIRVINGKGLFLNEHLDRLHKSVMLSQLDCLDINNIRSNILKLLKANYVKEKNLKLNFYCQNTQQELYAFFIESHYPSNEVYQKGVRVELLPIERHNPNVKLENPLLRGSADKALCMSQTHEMLLVNAQGFITEGSRSNFFAVFGNKLVTPPAQQVLQGITRQMVIKLALNNNIPIEERPIHTSEITEMDGAFITGTSSKVLPIAKITDHVFAPIPETTSKMMKLYDLLMEESLTSNIEN
jgi:branched-chain amino acid aminotransferase